MMIAAYVKIKATGVSMIARQVLDTGCAGEVVSVFTSCINILTDDDSLLTIFPSVYPYTPSGIYADFGGSADLSYMDFKSGMKVMTGSGVVVIPDAGFILDVSEAAVLSGIVLPDGYIARAECIRENIERFDVLFARHLTEKSRGYLSGWRKFLSRNAELSAESAYPEHLLDELRGLFNAVKTHDVNGIRHALLRTIGSGIGLTPSSDDIICGASAWLFYRNRAKWSYWFDALQDFIEREGRNRTSLISRKYLEFAAQGAFTEPLGRLASSLLASSDTGALEDMTKKIISYGHSSGLETCLGIQAGYWITDI